MRFDKRSAKSAMPRTIALRSIPVSAITGLIDYQAWSIVMRGKTKVLKMRQDIRI
jgi:hypothetical protein